MLRGGSFDLNARLARAASRLYYYPYFRLWYFGLRVGVAAAHSSQSVRLAGNVTRLRPALSKVEGLVTEAA